MKHISLPAVFSVLLIAAVSAFADNFFVVTEIDMLGAKTFSVKNREGVKEIQAKVAAEAKLFPKIVILKKKEWDAKPDEHQFKWQGNKLKARAIKISQAYSDQEKAQEKADKQTDKELGINDQPKKASKKLSEAEQEKKYNEAKKLSELSGLAEDIQKAIEAALASAGEKK